MTLKCFHSYLKAFAKYFGDQITASFSHVEMFAVCHKENIQLQNYCQIQNESFSSLKIFVSSFSLSICLLRRMVSSTQHKHREKKIKIGSGLIAG